MGSSQFYANCEGGNMKDYLTCPECGGNMYNPTDKIWTMCPTCLRKRGNKVRMKLVRGSASSMNSLEIQEERVNNDE